MKKLLLLGAQFRLNLLSNLFFIIQCALVLLLANATISGIVYGGFVGRYYTNLDKDRTFFLSSAVKNHVGFGDSEGFYRLVEDISAISGVSGVGYQVEEAFLTGSNQDVIVHGFILGGDMADIRYPLSQGRWFDGTGACGGETQVILGGEIARLYETDESITLYRLSATDQGMQYVPVEARVIGKMRAPGFALSLNYASTQPEYTNMFEPYPSLILTDDLSLVSREDVRFPLMSLLVFAGQYADVQAVKEELRRYGQPFDFHEIDKFYDAAVSFRLANQLPTTGIMVLGILFGVTGITYLGVYQNMRAISVYHLCGMSRRGCAYMNMALNAVMLAAALSVAVVLYFVPAVQEHLFRRAMFGAYNLLFSVAFIIAVMGISFLISFGFSKKSPVMALRRFE